MLIKRLIIALVLVTSAFAARAYADEIRLQENAPDSYTVVKGDTLWDISGRFLKDPWRWPEIWNMNREEISNPHWIYPGDTIVLDRSSGTPRLSLVRGKAGATAVATNGPTKLGPRIRIEKGADQAIASIPAADIEPFLAQPLVIEANGLDAAPRIVATQENRVAVGAGHTAYVEGIGDKAGLDWQIFRPGKELRDPDTNELLGYEAVYLGDARVTRAGNPATVEIVRSKLEILRDDRLVPAAAEPFRSYVPHAPERKIHGRIISAYGAIAEVAENAIVTLNRGKRDGLEYGHVLAALRHGDEVDSVQHPGQKIKLPDERTGLVFVFRVFDRVSYALVMRSRLQMHVFDVVQTP